ncbi:hypothetical protein [Glutamicibacter sp. NPDC090743]|uniref:hypothetical protein n=1 Tax=Glutamicibacter sp. NPDC090743 TaxID=3364001 RepID=UPI0037FB8E55
MQPAQPDNTFEADSAKRQYAHNCRGPRDAQLKKWYGVSRGTGLELQHRGQSAAIKTTMQQRRECHEQAEQLSEVLQKYLG